MAEGIEKGEKKMALTQNEFITIKTLQNSGASNQEIAIFMKLTPQKVGIATRSETYEEYKNNCYVVSKRAIEAKKNKGAKKAVPDEVKAPEPEKPADPPVQVVEHRQSVTIQATHYMQQTLNEQLQMLKLISAKLALIVDDLCGTKDVTG